METLPCSQGVQQGLSQLQEYAEHHHVPESCCTSVAQKTSLLYPPAEGSKSPKDSTWVLSSLMTMTSIVSFSCFCFRKAKSYFSLFCGLVPLKPALLVHLFS